MNITEFIDLHKKYFFALLVVISVSENNVCNFAKTLKDLKNKGKSAIIM